MILQKFLAVALLSVGIASAGDLDSVNYRISQEGISAKRRLAAEGFIPLIQSRRIADGLTACLGSASGKKALLCTDLDSLVKAIEKVPPDQALLRPEINRLARDIRLRFLEARYDAPDSTCALADRFPILRLNTFLLVSGTRSGGVRLQFRKESKAAIYNLSAQIAAKAKILEMVNSKRRQTFKVAANAVFPQLDTLLQFAIAQSCLCAGADAWNSLTDKEKEYLDGQIFVALGQPIQTADKDLGAYVHKLDLLLHDAVFAPEETGLIPISGYFETRTSIAKEDSVRLIESLVNFGEKNKSLAVVIDRSDSTTWANPKLKILDTLVKKEISRLSMEISFLRPGRPTSASVPYHLYQDEVSVNEWLDALASITQDISQERMDSWGNFYFPQLDLDLRNRLFSGSRSNQTKLLDSLWAKSPGLLYSTRAWTNNIKLIVKLAEGN